MIKVSEFLTNLSSFLRLARHRRGNRLHDMEPAFLTELLESKVLLHAGSLSELGGDVVLKHNMDDSEAPHVLGTYAAGPAAAVVVEGENHFLRLANNVAVSNNTITFDRAVVGAHGRTIIDFHFRITPQNGSADGFGIALLKTSSYGDHGAIGPPAPKYTPEDPSFPDAISFGFDIYQNVNLGDPNANHVSIHYNGTTLVQQPVTAIDLDSGQWIHGTIVVIAGGADPDVSVILQQDGGQPVHVIDHFKVPGLEAYETRLWVGARSGGQSALHDCKRTPVP